MYIARDSEQANKLIQYCARQVACDLGYALACLEKVHARRSDAMLARRDYDSYYAATTTTSLLRHMPIHVVAMAVYAGHMASFATGLGPSADTCQANVLEAEWQLRRMQHPEQRLPLTERCVRIQWSIWLAGGFSVAAAFLVIMIHAVTLAARICGVVWERGGGAREESEEDGGGGGSEALEAGGREASERVGRGQEAVKGKADWTEAFLECLLP